VRAFEAMQRQVPRRRLLLVGDGPARPTGGPAAGARCSPASAAASDLAAHYASADLFLFPSLTETFGNVTTEAMASGCRWWPSTTRPRRS
jgi:glycosyltransferase involved in cell wall biosynthesis